MSGKDNQLKLFKMKEWWEDDWEGMPEYISKKNNSYACINIRFENEEDLQKFAKIIGQKLTHKTKSIWYPFKSHWGNCEQGIYKSES